VFEKTKVYRRLILIVLIAVQGMTACKTLWKSQGADDSQRSDQQTGYHEHTVRWPGETLSNIAKWYTGDANNWSILARENPMIHPASIKIGDKIRIPQQILTKSEPLPRSAVGTHASKARRTQAPKGAPQGNRETAAELGEETAPGKVREATPQAEALEFYGPKE
jgi:hypothetical protein